MNTPTSQVASAEQILLDCVQEQSIVFADAVLLIEQLEKAAHRRELGEPDSVSQLQRSLNHVVSAQQKISTAYAGFSSLKLNPSPILKDSLARHEQQLKALLGRINALQSIFEKMRDDMSPQLDIDTRRKSMHSAYQKSLKSV
jgi:hypothetical protein